MTLCFRCEETEATIQCDDCPKSEDNEPSLLCAECNVIMHVGKKYVAHKRISIMHTEVREETEKKYKEYEREMKSLIQKRQELDLLEVNLQELARVHERNIRRTVVALQEKLKKQAGVLTRQIRGEVESIGSKITVSRELLLGAISSMKPCVDEVKKTLALGDKEFVECSRDTNSIIHKQWIRPDVSIEAPKILFDFSLDLSPLTAAIEALELNLTPSDGTSEVLELDAPNFSPDEEHVVMLCSTLKRNGTLNLSPIHQHDKVLTLSKISMRIRSEFLEDSSWQTYGSTGTAPEVSDKVCARHPEDRKWYRAIIQDKPPNKNEYIVMMLDYGNLIAVTADNLLPWRNVAPKCQFQAVECCLFETTDVKLQSEAIWSFQDLTNQQGEFMCQFLQRLPDSDIWQVELFVERRGNKVSVNDVVQQEAEKSSQSKSSIGCRDIRYQSQSAELLLVSTKSESPSESKIAQEDGNKTPSSTTVKTDDCSETGTTETGTTVDQCSVKSESQQAGTIESETEGKHGVEKPESAEVLEMVKEATQADSSKESLEDKSGLQTSATQVDSSKEFSEDKSEAPQNSATQADSSKESSQDKSEAHPTSATPADSSKESVEDKSKAHHTSATQADSSKESSEDKSEAHPTSATPADSSKESVEDKSESPQNSATQADSSKESSEDKSESPQNSATQADSSKESAEDKSEAPQNSATQADSSQESAEDKSEAHPTSATPADSSQESSEDKSEAHPTSATQADSSQESAEDKSEAHPTSATQADSSKESSEDKSEAHPTSAKDSTSSDEVNSVPSEIVVSDNISNESQMCNISADGDNVDKPLTVGDCGTPDGCHSTAENFDEELKLVCDDKSSIEITAGSEIIDDCVVEEPLGDNSLYKLENLPDSDVVPEDATETNIEPHIINLIKEINAAAISSVDLDASESEKLTSGMDNHQPCASMVEDESAENGDNKTNPAQLGDVYACEEEKIGACGGIDPFFKKDAVDTSSSGVSDVLLDLMLRATSGDDLSSDRIKLDKEEIPTQVLVGNPTENDLVCPPTAGQTDIIDLIEKEFCDESCAVLVMDRIPENSINQGKLELKDQITSLTEGQEVSIPSAVDTHQEIMSNYEQNSEMREAIESKQPVDVSSITVEITDVGCDTISKSANSEIEYSVLNEPQQIIDTYVNPEPEISPFLNVTSDENLQDLLSESVEQKTLQLSPEDQNKFQSRMVSDENGEKDQEDVLEVDTKDCCSNAIEVGNIDGDIVFSDDQAPSVRDYMPPTPEVIRAAKQTPGGGSSEHYEDINECDETNPVDIHTEIHIEQFDHSEMSLDSHQIIQNNENSAPNTGEYFGQNITDNVSSGEPITSAGATHDSVLNSTSDPMDMNVAAVYTPPPPPPCSWGNQSVKPIDTTDSTNLAFPVKSPEKGRPILKNNNPPFGPSDPDNTAMFVTTENVSRIRSSPDGSSATVGPRPSQEGVAAGVSQRHSNKSGRRNVDVQVMKENQKKEIQAKKETSSTAELHKREIAKNLAQITIYDGCTFRGSVASPLAEDGSFWFRLAQTAAQKQTFKRMQKHVNGVAVLAVGVVEPQINLCVLVHDKNQTEWHRGIIEGITGSKADVRLQDFGIVRRVPVSELKQMLDTFSGWAYQAIKCCLASDIYLSFTPEDQHHFASLVKGKELQATVVQHFQYKTYVQLVDDSQDPPVSIYNVLVASAMKRMYQLQPLYYCGPDGEIFTVQGIPQQYPGGLMDQSTPQAGVTKAGLPIVSPDLCHPPPNFFNKQVPPPFQPSQLSPPSQYRSPGSHPQPSPPIRAGPNYIDRNRSTNLHHNTPVDSLSPDMHFGYNMPLSGMQHEGAMSNIQMAYMYGMLQGLQGVPVRPPHEPEQHQMGLDSHKSHKKQSSTPERMSSSPAEPSSPCLSKTSSVDQQQTTENKHQATAIPSSMNTHQVASPLTSSDIHQVTSPSATNTQSHQGDIGSQNNGFDEEAWLENDGIVPIVSQDRVGSLPSNQAQGYGPSSKEDARSRPHESRGAETHSSGGFNSQNRSGRGFGREGPVRDRHASSPRRNTRACFYCKEEGHYVHECPVRHPQGPRRDSQRHMKN